MSNNLNFLIVILELSLFLDEILVNDFLTNIVQTLQRSFNCDFQFLLFWRRWLNKVGDLPDARLRFNDLDARKSLWHPSLDFICLHSLIPLRSWRSFKIDFFHVAAVLIDVNKNLLHLLVCGNLPDHHHRWLLFLNFNDMTARRRVRLVRFNDARVVNQSGFVRRFVYTKRFLFRQRNSIRLWRLWRNLRYIHLSRRSLIVELNLLKGPWTGIHRVLLIPGIIPVFVRLRRDAYILVVLIILSLSAILLMRRNFAIYFRKDISERGHRCWDSNINFSVFFGNVRSWHNFWGLCNFWFYI